MAWNWRAGTTVLVISLWTGAGLLGCGDESSAPRGSRVAGQTCQASPECESGLCLAVSDTRNVCTIPCQAGGTQCPGGQPWTCEATAELGQTVCVCRSNSAREICGDGVDNECNGAVDDCQLCGNRLVPLDDRVNCGACGNVCPIDGMCLDGQCTCPAGGCSDAGGVGPECLDAADCNDAIACTEDTCAGQRCIHRVVPARCPSGEVCDLRMGGCIASRPCATSSDCNDTDPCTTNETCDPSTKVCLWVPLDGDHDSDPPRVCGGTDCDDDDPFTLLGADERCDGVDNNCDGAIDVPLASNACSEDRSCQLGDCRCNAGTECGLPSCIDTNTDVLHCGACFNDCPGTASCQSGVCTCPNGGIICNGTCTDAMTDRYNCGGCSTFCTSTQACVTGSCMDVDECASGTDNCHANATCTNADPGFTCTCNAGFGGTGVSCAPDECATDVDNCDVNATCSDTLAGFTCSCINGYSGNGVTCSDISECINNSDGCDSSPDACVNTDGSFMCVCPSGYTGTGVGSNGCADINECAPGGTSNCDVNAYCTNIGGSFTCTCNANYGGDGVTCLPIAYLSGLTISSGTLSPAYAAVTLNYAVSVPLGTDSISVTPSTAGSAEIRVNGEVVLSGTPSSPIALNLGINAISVVLSGVGYATTTYTINVTRGTSTYVKASNTSSSDQFGQAVAVSGDTMVVGAPYEDWNYTDTGAAYVFTRVNGTWSQQAVLRSASQTTGSRQFGAAVAISGDTIVVGSRWDDVTFTDSGAAHVFVRVSGVWSEQQKLKASNPGPSDYFGTSVSVSGDTIVVGASAEDSNAVGVDGDGTNNTLADSGAAYVFTRSGTVWSQQAYLKASNSGQADYFGNSVAVSGDTVAVGAHYESSNATGINGNQSNDLAGYSGAAYVFVRSGVVWSQQAYVKASNAEGGDYFGFSVALSGNTLAVGAEYEDGLDGPGDNNAVDSGAAYVFTRSATTWSQQAYVKAYNVGANDYFGYSVSISGNALLVGAYTEDGSATGINGALNDLLADSGAAYLYNRSGSVWTQSAYLKASNTNGSDYFGCSVAVDGTTNVVGAYGEDSSSVGINGVQTNNSYSVAGAAYVY